MIDWLNPKTIYLVFTSTMLSTQFRANTDWLGISKKIPSYAVGLSIDCRVSELAL